jgi:hypothetical protein
MKQTCQNFIQNMNWMEAWNKKNKTKFFFKLVLMQLRELPLFIHVWGVNKRKFPCKLPYGPLFEKLSWAPFNYTLWIKSGWLWMNFIQMMNYAKLKYHFSLINYENNYMSNDLHSGKLYGMPSMTPNLNSNHVTKLFLNWTRFLSLF